MQIHISCAFLLAAFFAPVSAIATAQITPIGPFTGASSETFDTLLSGQFACHPQRILEGTAELCATGSGQIFVGGASHCSCILQPLGQLHALCTGMGPARIRFTVPVVRFGGYLALNCTLPDGTANFFDPNGLLLGSLPLTIPNDCTYRWYGFSAPAGATIGSVELSSSYPHGALLHLDNLEADPTASVEVYCSAKMNSLNCFPRIEVEGVPTAGATSGWVVRAVKVRPGGIVGTLLYAVGGNRAAQPFQCGLLCIGPSGVRRTVQCQSTPQGTLCDGAYSLDMNAFSSGALGGNPSAALSITGTMVRCQWWGRDQGFQPPCNTTLSNAVEYVIQ